jgi:hypothetical protein
MKKKNVCLKQHKEKVKWWIGQSRADNKYMKIENEKEIWSRWIE